MLINFFHGLRDAGVPVTTRELLDLLEGLKRHMAFADMAFAKGCDRVSLIFNVPFKSECYRA